MDEGVPEPNSFPDGQIKKERCRKLGDHVKPDYPGPYGQPVFDMNRR